MKRLPVVASLMLVLAGCGGDPGSRDRAAEAECAPQVRYNGVLYRGAGYTDQTPEGRLGHADQAECHDEGGEAEGSVFSDEPPQVAVWTFDGYSPEEVVGVRFGQDSFSVFVAESMSRDRVDQITDVLGGSD